MATNTFNNPSSFGSFVPTTNVWDVGEILAIPNLDPKLQEVLVRLYQNLNLMSLVLNIKDSGFYDLSEFVNGQLWFPNQATPATTFDTADSLYRQAFRTVVFFPNLLPTPGTSTQPHNITVTASTTWTRIYGAATNPSTLVGIPLPYVSLTPNESIQLDVDNTNISITTAASYAGYFAIVVVEYLQS
jgi:hypothetical protein